ncbi:hypothetical protein G6F50_016918 [Rhizopus delemar]|uniref:Uncharacterized protein n=1 Tax=Rhizopus delemar TaxID=936053 RepID=A0A9P7C0H5_9FUNG|nr:hypothetical protein G6F50_016918 [Rhizopus delemar]
MKRAPSRRLDRVRHFAAHGFPVAPGVFQVWNRIQQHPRVRMLRRIEQPVGGRLLDDPAQVHHRHAVGHVAHDRQVVADEHVRQAEFLLQVAHQVQDLRLDGYVQCGGGLVADQEARARGQRAGDADALARAT